MRLIILLITFFFLSLGNLALSNKNTPGRSRYPLHLSVLDKKIFMNKIAMVISQNETNCKPENLIHWNENEAFPSLGIGHAIWFTAQARMGYDEGFPQLVDFLKTKIKQQPAKQTPQILLPPVLSPTPLGPAPWASRQEFLTSPLREELRQFFSQPLVMEWQTEFMFERMQQAVYKILLAIESEKPNGRKNAKKAHKQLQLLFLSEDGVLSLIDYVNFKGAGLVATEVSPLGQLPWGLKTVLEKMSEVEPETVVCDKKDKRHYSIAKCANYAFAEAAMWSLTRLAQSWGDRGTEERVLREKWLNGGWARRVRETYLPGAVERVNCTL